MIDVFLAGEGRNELGGFAVEPAHRFAPRGARPAMPEPGVLEALLRQVRADGWRVVDAIPWKKLPKLQVGLGGRGEAENVRRAHHHAKRRGCAVLVFSRDRDGPKFAQREHDIEGALRTLAESGDGPAIVGAVAIEKLESWLTAIAGQHGSEYLRRPEEKLTELGVGAKDTPAMVALVEARGLGAIPPDAASLRRWLDRARDALGAGGGADSGG